MLFKAPLPNALLVTALGNAVNACSRDFASDEAQRLDGSRG